MEIEVRGDSVVISGYINAVERNSRPITEYVGGKIRTFVERIKAGVFRNALKRNDNVLVLLNHNLDRVLASTREGTAKLEEDNIGLRGEITITDAEVVKKARENKLSGWSFGFFCNSDEVSIDGDRELRTVTDMDLAEVSILDDTRTPAYYGTSIESRGGENMKLEIRADSIESAGEEEKTVEVDVNYLANMIADIVIAKLSEKEKAEDVAEEMAKQQLDVSSSGEQREIDYSVYENRLSNLDK